MKAIGLPLIYNELCLSYFCHHFRT